MKEAPHVEFSPWLKRLGFVVFGVLCVPGLIAVAVFHAANVDKVQAFTPYLAVIGVSGAIGLFVHALTHLALTPFNTTKVKVQCDGREGQVRECVYEKPDGA
jgi:hypothetical protein